MILVDTVYQTVLALANKEQRGYITPQEFNLHANHVQMSIFEQYFYDLNQFRRQPGNTTKYADMINIIEDKLRDFKVGFTNIGSGSSIEDAYRIISVISGDDDNVKIVEEIKLEDRHKIDHSPLTKATVNRPVYWISDGSIYFSPSDILNPVKYSYMRKPDSPKWTYIVVDEKPLYNDGAVDKKNFELHPSEQEALVIKILQLCGVTIKDYNLTQVAAQEEVKNIQQQKQ